MENKELNETAINPLEDQRKSALEHYKDISSRCHHWSGFVERAIKEWQPISQQPVEAVSENNEAVEFADWCADNFKKMHTLWHPYNSYTTKCEDKNYTTQELFQKFKKTH